MRWLSELRSAARNAVSDLRRVTGFGLLTLLGSIGAGLVAAAATGQWTPSAVVTWVWLAGVLLGTYLYYVRKNLKGWNGEWFLRVAPNPVPTISLHLMRRQVSAEPVHSLPVFRCVLLDPTGAEAEAETTGDQSFFQFPYYDFLSMVPPVPGTYRVRFDIRSRRGHWRTVIKSGFWMEPQDATTYRVEASA